MKKLLYTIISIAVIGCTTSTKETETDNGKDGWLKGNTSEKFDVVTNHLRGFDMTMVETGYRYQELYWAGKDRNWDYALYQLKKIRKTIENGIERRPKRGKSAKDFLESSLPKMEEMIKTADTLTFDQSFDQLTTSCNNCHAKENVAFFTVQKPINRQSPIRK